MTHGVSDEHNKPAPAVRARPAAEGEAVPTSSANPDLLVTRASPDLLVTRASPDLLVTRASPDLLATRASPDLLATRASPDLLVTRDARDSGGPAASEELPRTDSMTASTPRTRASQRAGDEPALPGEGDRVGRFVVLRELGRGAMGVVFAAYDEELARRVALKLMHLGPQRDVSAGRSQLLREAQALARLAHPNVVAVYEAGVWGSSVYMAMEYVQGVDLHDWLAIERRPWQEVLLVLRQAGEGLLAAHRSGLVHRDFKPSNVLVGDDGRARVADFGLAAGRGEFISAEATQSGPTLLTNTIAGEGALVGTPAYMAPEQIRREETSAQSDQFSFCVTLYEALHGVRPFVGRDFAGLALAIQAAELPTPPAHSPVPAWIHPLLVRGLAKDPAARFPSLAELLAELARDPAAERARRRRLALQLLATATLTMLAIAGGIQLYGALVLHAAERRADARLEQLREQLADPRVQADPAAADRLLRAFVDYPDNRGTAAVSRAYRERADELIDPDAAVDAFAGAYLTAIDKTDEITALRGLVPGLVAAGRHLEAGEALATLDRRAPELAADPELALARRTAALHARDLPAAAAALAGLADDDPTKTYGQVLEHMSHATAMAPAQFGQAGPQRRVFSVADLDGDGRDELATEALAQGDGVFSLTRADSELRPLGLVRAGPTSDSLQLLPHRLAGAPLALVSGRRPELAVDRPHRLVELLADGSTAERFAWADSKLCAPAVADLDGDGQAELYVGSGAYARQLSRIDRGADGRWRRSQVMAQIDRISSDITGLASADLDGDRREELIVALGPWRAYDLRILRGGPDGAVEQLARKTVGFVSALALVRVGAEVWIAAAKYDEHASANRFSPSAPYGPPAGIYLFALRDRQIVEVGYFANPGRPRYELPLLVADLDGDGQDDLVVGARGPDAGDDSSSYTAVLRQHHGAFLTPLVIRGLHVHAALELDGDPARELLVSSERGGTGDYYLLGVGDGALPPLPLPRSEPRPVPVRVTDPTLTAAWRRAEDMVAVGLPQRSAVELSALSGLAGPVREDLLLRAGELFALAGEHEAAATHFIAAAERRDLAAEALAGAIRSRRARGEIAAETSLAARRAALPDLAPAERRAAADALARLSRASAPRPELALRFDQPLDPHWELRDPLALAREPGAGALRLHNAPDGVIASLPLRHDGGTIDVTIDVELELAEWGSEFEIWLGADDTPVSRMRLVGQGSVETPGFQFMDHDPQETIKLPQLPVGRIRLHHVLYPELQLETITIEIPGIPPIRRVRERPLSLPATLSLELRTRTTSRSLIARARLHGITLTGLTLAELPAPDPRRALVRAIVEGELMTALAALPPIEALAPGDLRLLWRAELLARIGDIEASALALRRALDVSADDPIYKAFVLHMHATDGPLRLVARRALGPGLVAMLHDPVVLTHPWRPGAVGEALAQLAGWSRDPDPAATSKQLADQALALMLRGEAWRRFGRPDLAGPDLAAAAAIIAIPNPELPPQLLDEVLQNRLDLAVGGGDRTNALAMMTAMLQGSTAPAILLERLRGRAELVALLRDEDWAVLTGLARD